MSSAFESLHDVKAVVERLAKDELRYGESFWSMRARVFDELCDLLGVEHHTYDGRKPEKDEEAP